MIKQFLIRHIIKAQDLKGFALVKKLNNSTMESAFSRITARRHAINTAIDVGASDGSWTHSGKQISYLSRKTGPNLLILITNTWER